MSRVDGVIQAVINGREYAGIVRNPAAVQRGGESQPAALLFSVGELVHPRRHEVVLLRGVTQHANNITRRRNK